MGHVQEKYTKTYFTGKNKNGTPAGYGLEGNYKGMETSLRDFDIQILKRINLKDSHVLEIGYGRGESIKYIMNEGASSYIGVDFAPPAFEIAQEYLKKHGLTAPKIYCSDALDFLRDHGDKIENKIDIVIMLDVLEHIPRSELSLIMSYLKKYLSEKAVLVINTPAYKFDNDVIVDGLDERNLINTVDHADLIEETKGMHCNKYTISSLPKFMRKNEFLNLTEYQIYIHNHDNFFNPEFNSGIIIPYSQLWKKAQNYGFPLKGEYIADCLEYAYQIDNQLEVVSCTHQTFEGIKLLSTPSLVQGYEDDGALSFFENHIKKGQIVFDVGAYIGLSSLYFSKKVGKTGKVIAFEPNKYNQNRIQYNYSLNPQFLDNIQLYNFGLSDVNESAEMLLSDNIENGFASASQLVTGGCTAIPKSELESMGFFRETVKLKTLDSFVEETGIIPDVIKVDIEGAELSFLKGSVNTLKKHKPLLFIELHNVFATCFVIKLLEELNYEFHVLSEEWGNRVQMLANYGDKSLIGLSDHTKIDNLFKAYNSSKAKVYQENLEAYALSQTLKNKSLQLAYSDLLRKCNMLYKFFPIKFAVSLLKKYKMI